jgi:hypothetical protein
MKPKHERLAHCHGRLNRLNMHLHALPVGKRKTLDGQNSIGADFRVSVKGSHALKLYRQSRGDSTETFKQQAAQGYWVADR